MGFFSFDCGTWTQKKIFLALCEADKTLKQVQGDSFSNNREKIKKSIIRLKIQPAAILKNLPDEKWVIENESALGVTFQGEDFQH